MGCLPPQAKGTSDFLLETNEWFAALNSSSIEQGDENGRGKLLQLKQKNKKFRACLTLDFPVEIQ